MEIIQLVALSQKEMIEKVANTVLDLEELRDILTDTGYMSKTIEEAFGQVIVLLEEVAGDIRADQESQRKGK